jgi:hypothetical protein
MNLDLEYAIKKDIRNNPVVREVDLDHKRQLMRTVGLTVLVVAMLVFWAWQRFDMVKDRYDESKMRAELNLELERNRQFRLEVDTLLAPQRVETEATRDLHMVAPTQATTLLLEPSPAPAHATVIR